jgi:hypothetical protein
MGRQCDLQPGMQKFKAHPQCDEWCEHGLAVAVKMPCTDGEEIVIESRVDALDLKVNKLDALQMMLCYCILRPLGALFGRGTTKQDSPTPSPMHRLHGFITECCEGGSMHNCLSRRTQPRCLSCCSRMFQLPLWARLDAARAGRVHGGLLVRPKAETGFQSPAYYIPYISNLHGLCGTDICLHILCQQLGPACRVPTTQYCPSSHELTSTCAPDVQPSTDAQKSCLMLQDTSHLGSPHRPRKRAQNGQCRVCGGLLVGPQQGLASRAQALPVRNSWSHLRWRTRK